jgi:hypothetical protein
VGGESHKRFVSVHLLYVLVKNCDGVVASVHTDVQVYVKNIVFHDLVGNTPYPCLRLL